MSHKWGAADFLKLESKHIGEFRTQVPIQNLRPTIRDAIEATRVLGFKYAWIDSLCIIQDSKEDWEKESVMMHLVYRNAVCTLAASEAEYLEQGLLDIAKPTVQASFTHLLELFGNPEEFIIHFDPKLFLWMRLAQSPLLKRGWVVQERLLSRRTIYFGSPLIWECRECLQINGNTGGIRIQYPLMPQFKVWPSLLNREENPYNNWTSTVEAFTKCSLSHAGDKLVAMWGIAKTFSPVLHSDYLCGIWEDYLPQGLLWRLDKISNEDASLHNPTPGSQSYVGMSEIATIATGLMIISSILVMGFYSRQRDFCCTCC